MSEDNKGESETVLTRRQAMSTGGAVAGAALLSKYSIRPASAQSTEPRIQLGDDWEIDDESMGDGTTDLALKHLPSGASLRYDASAGEWSVGNISIGKLTSALDANGQNINNAGTVSTNSIQSSTNQIWEEDPNSPFKISSSASGTYTMGKNYDIIKVLFFGGSLSSFQHLTINGNTATNYRHAKADGTTTTGDSKFADSLVAGSCSGVEWTMTGKWSSGFGINCRYNIDDLTYMDSGRNLNLTSPLNSFTLEDDGSQNFSITAKVYGINQ